MFNFCSFILTLNVCVCLVSSDIVSLVSLWITPPVLMLTTRLFFWVRSEESFWSSWQRCGAAFSMTVCFWRSWTSTTLTSVYSVIYTPSSGYSRSRAVAKWKGTLWKFICRWLFWTTRPWSNKQWMMKEKQKSHIILSLKTHYIKWRHTHLYLTQWCHHFRLLSTKLIFMTSGVLTG